jgi:hypothetical protein
MHQHHARSQFRINGVDRKYDGTAMYDAMHATMQQLTNSPAYMRRTLVLFTDGDDNASRVSADSVLQRALQLGVSIHAIVLGQSNAPVLELLTKHTGGRVQYVSDIYDADHAFMTVYKGTYDRCSVTIWHSLAAPGAVLGMELPTRADSTLTVLHTELPNSLQHIPLADSTCANELLLHAPALTWCHPPSTVEQYRIIDDLGDVLTAHPDMVVAFLRPSDEPCSNDDVRTTFDSLRSTLERAAIAPSRLFQGASVLDKLGGKVPTSASAVYLVLFRP